MAYDSNYCITPKDYPVKDYPEYYYNDKGDRNKTSKDLLSWRDFILRNPGRTLAVVQRWHDLDENRIKILKAARAGKTIRKGVRGNPVLYYQEGEADHGLLSWTDFRHRNPDRSIHDVNKWFELGGEYV